MPGKHGDMPDMFRRLGCVGAIQGPPAALHHRVPGAPRTRWPCAPAAAATRNSRSPGARRASSVPRLSALRGRGGRLQCRTQRSLRGSSDAARVTSPKGTCRWRLDSWQVTVFPRCGGPCRRRCGLEPLSGLGSASGGWAWRSGMVTMRPRGGPHALCDLSAPRASGHPSLQHPGTHGACMVGPTASMFS